MPLCEYCLVRQGAACRYKPYRPVAQLLDELFGGVVPPKIWRLVDEAWFAECHVLQEMCKRVRAVLRQARMPSAWVPA